MADKRVTVTIEAIDKTTSVIKSIEQALSGLGGKASKSLAQLAALGTTEGALKSVAKGFKEIDAATRMGGGITQYKNALNDVTGVVKNVIGGTAELGKTFLSFAGNVANADLSFTGLTKTSMNYDQTIERIGIKAGATDGEMAKLGNTIKKLTTDTVYSMDEIAGAAEYMVQNGRTATQVVDELGSVAGLATVGNVSLAKSADIVASTMNMFSRQGITAAQAANIFAKAANSSGANVEQLAKSLENCGPSAAQLNIPFSQVIATLSLMGDNAIKSGKAGTALKNLFQRMSSPTKEAAAAIEKFGLETARTKIVSGDLKGGLLEMQKQMDRNKYSSDELATGAKQLAGSWGQQGLTAVLSTSTDKLMVMFDAMEKGLITTNDLENGMNKLMSTVQGQVMRFSANVQLAFYNLYKGANSSIAKVMEVFNNFFSMLNSGAGIQSALKYLEMEFNKFPQIAVNAISKGIDGINNFINGGSLDSILKIGSNIITGICDGIIKNEAKIKEGVSSLIGKFADFIRINTPKITEAARVILDALKTGIQNNSDKLSQAADTVMELLNTYIGGRQEIILEAGKTIAVPLATGFLQGCGESFMNIGGAISEFILTSAVDAISSVYDFGFNLAGQLWDGWMANLMNGPGGKKDLNLGQMIRNAWNYVTGKDGSSEAGNKSGQSYTTGAQTAIDGKPYKLNESNFVDSYNQFQQNGITGGQKFTGGVGSAIDQSKAEIISKGSEVGTGTAKAIEDGLNSMNTDQLKELKTAIDEVGQVTKSTASSMKSSFTSITDSARTSFMGLANIARNQMVNVSNIIRNQITNATNSVRSQCVNMANIFRNQFVSMANVARNQMVNVSNIIRNQAMSWSNVIRNQVQNARNAFTQQFISMANVARTQMVNISNIVRNQAMSWSNIIRNQASNARNALTSSFMSMAAVARNQMANVLSVVRSYMSQIAAACNRTLTLKVNISKTETTTKKVVVENSPKSLNMPQSSSLSASGYTRSATAIGLGTLVGALSSASTGSDRAISIEVPLVLEGREIARASAIYTREELARLEKRNNRKRGE